MAGITHLTLTITLELTRYESGVEIRIWNWEKVQSVNTSPYKSVIKKSGKYIHRNIKIIQAVFIENFLHAKHYAKQYLLSILHARHLC